MKPLRALTGPQRSRHVAQAAVLLLAVLIPLLFFVFFPLFLASLGRERGDWEHLGQIGSAYGAASALLAVLALLGVAGSLVMQAREAKSAREQSLRALHADLMRMAMDDPELLECWGEHVRSDEVRIQRQHIYSNLIVSHWQMMYELNAMTEQHLRSLAHIMFSGEAGRRFWGVTRELRLNSLGTRRERRFYAILDEEYRSATPD